MQAMQHYQDSINQINQFNATQQQQLQMQQADLTNKLQVAQTYLQSYTGNNMPANQQAPTTGIGVNTPVGTQIQQGIQSGGLQLGYDPNNLNQNQTQSTHTGGQSMLPIAQFNSLIQ